MRDGITSVDIEPASTQIYFLGATHDPSIADETQLLKGCIRLVLTKTIKIKSITVKFKGNSTIFQSKMQDQYQYEISSPILPKLKARMYEKTTTLAPGEHLLPWELEIPNIYPMTFFNKKCNIKYKVQMKMSLGINRTITSSRSIVINRHLLASRKLAALVNTSLFEYAFVNGFQYRIEVPKMACTEQMYVPVSINFNQIAGIPIEYISTQITQVEIYRCRHISNGEADVAIGSKKNGVIPLYEQHRLGDSGLIKYIRSMQPVIKNSIDRQQDYSTIPLLIRHSLEPTLSHGIESPLVAVSHQLDVLFNFGPQHDEVRVKVPIIVSSVPDSDKSGSTPYTMETTLHKLPVSVDSRLPLKKTDSHRSTMDDSIINQVKDNLMITEPLKKSISDQDLKESSSSSTASKDRPRSITPPTHPLPSSPTLYASSVKSKKSDETMNGSFMGLHPPPRRNRHKKEVNLTLSSATKYTPYHSGSRPSSPVSPRTPKYSMPDQQQQQQSLPPPPPPLTPRRRQFLNQSKSTNTSNNNYNHHHSNNNNNNHIKPGLIKRRSNSIDHPIPNNMIYASSITSHYVSAELPPVPPPAITEQRLPSLPIVDKSEHRKTRMYYDDESDEEETTTYDDLLYSE